MRGQYLVFEQVLLFGLGVVILIFCFTAFTLYQNHFSQVAMVDQLEEVSGLVTSNMIKLVSKNPGNDAWIIISIPKTVGVQPYEISFTPKGVNVTAKLTGEHVFSPALGLNDTFKLSGKASGNIGTCLIYKTGDKLIIK